MESCSDDQKDLKKFIENKPLKCHECAYATADKSRLIIHMRKHTGEKPFSCSQCNFTCAHSATLRNHKALHGEKKYTCEICGHKSAIISSYRYHVQLVHSKERNFPCSECPYKAKTRKCLIAHKRNHSPNFKCPHCDYKTARKVQLTVHIGAHVRDMGQEGSFECVLCDFKGYTPFGITRHMNDKHGEFKCDMCDEVFDARAKLNEHKEIHVKKRFLCDKCGHALKTSNQLTRHIKEKHPTDPNSVKECPQCSKTFSAKANYNAHLKTHDVTCKICNLDLKTRYNLVWHNKTIHSAEGNSKKRVQL